MDVVNYCEVSLQLLHVKTVLRVFPNELVLFPRDTNFAQGDWDGPESTNLIRPCLQTDIDFFLYGQGLLRICFKKAQLRIENIEFPFRF